METTTTSAPPTSLTAHLTQTSHTQTSHSSHDAAHTPPDGVHLGREHVKWGPEVWDRLDRAVHHEVHRARIAAKFLPHHRVDPHITTVQADQLLTTPSSSGTSSGTPAPVIGISILSAAAATGGSLAVPLSIDEGSFIRLIEIWTEFNLTPAQVQEEAKAHQGHKEPAGRHPAHEGHGGDHGHSGHSGHDHHHHHHPCSTAVTLARRAANTLSLAQDTIIFQGMNAFYGPGSGPNATTFPSLGSKLLIAPTSTSTAASALVQFRGQPLDGGLLCAGGNFASGTGNPMTAGGVIQVQQSSTTPIGYGQNTVAAVDAAYALLASSGYAGPYVTVLHFYPHADSLTPVPPATLVMPADRIKPLMEAGYHPSSVIGGTFPLKATPTSGTTPVQAYGLVMSIGGNTVDLVNGLNPVTAFSQVDPTGNFTFRVLTRFALRIKDPLAIVRLEFL